MLTPRINGNSYPRKWSLIPGRIEQTRQLLSNGLNRYRVHEAHWEAYRIRWRQSDRYIAKALRLVREHEQGKRCNFNVNVKVNPASSGAKVHQNPKKASKRSSKQKPLSGEQLTKRSTWYDLQVVDLE